MDKNSFPKVTIVIPCRNEERFIRKCLDSLIGQDYPKDKLEIFVLNGMSTDKTKQIVEKYSEKYSFIKAFDNPNKTSSYALNIGLKHSTGELFMHMGAHATYQNDHISKSVRYLIEYDADNVGGILRTLPSANTLMAKAITLVLSNKFGTGNAFFRIGSDKPIWVDTVFGGCYKKEMLVRVGGYNEKLARSQDMEMNMRLKKIRAKTLLVPDIVSCYYPKPTFNSFFKHNISDGIWAVYPIKFGVAVFNVRHLAPLAFILILVITAILGGFFKIFLWFFVLELIIYFGMSLLFSAKIAAKEKRLALIPFLVAGFFARHFGYGIGSFVGLIKLIF
ncbi:MAG: glycosyltransferase family 2 protein [Candidatus Paceibacterota bacterium]|jgi:glycosyltransferase involved in cell wall biosynthesis